MSTPRDDQKSADLLQQFGDVTPAAQPRSTAVDVVRRMVDRDLPPDIILATVEMIRGYEEQANTLREQATTDFQTGLLNRRGLKAAFDKSIHTLQRANYNARKADGPDATPKQNYFLFADMVGLKAINERYGHAVGDTGIVALAKGMESTCHRDGDAAARFGGDEVNLLFPAADANFPNLIHARLTEMQRNLYMDTPEGPRNLGLRYVMIPFDEKATFDEILEYGDPKHPKNKSLADRVIHLNPIANDPAVTPAKIAAPPAPGQAA